jgi:opacity protein-like surface antigen
MYRYLSIFAFIIAIFFIDYTFAEYPYIGIMGGGNGRLDLKSPKAEAEYGYYVGGSIGFRFLSLLRIEEELSFQRSRIDSVEKREIHFHHVKGDIKVWSLMTNLFVDLDCPFFITPYFGGGIGYENTKGNWRGEWVEITHHIQKHHTQEDFQKNGFAWQLIAGVKLPICLDVETGLEYRYFKIPDGSANHRFGLALTIQL